MKYTGAYEGTALGTITLCQDCGFAIQLRREVSAVIGDYDCWVHFRIPITPHIGRPVRCCDAGAMSCESCQLEGCDQPTCFCSCHLGH